jgi:hypothetical protein
MPIGQKDHECVAVTVPIDPGRLDQALDLVGGQMFTGAKFGVFWSSWPDCAFLVAGATRRRCEFIVILAPPLSITVHKLVVLCTLDRCLGAARSVNLRHSPFIRSQGGLQIHLLPGSLFFNISYSWCRQYPISEKSEAVAGRRWGLFQSWSGFCRIKRPDSTSGAKDLPIARDDPRLSGACSNRVCPTLKVPKARAGH